MSDHFVSNTLAHYGKAPLITCINVLVLSLGMACFFTALGISSYWSESDSGFDNRDRIRLITQGFVFPERRIREGPFVADPVARYVREDVPELEAVAQLGAGGPGTYLYQGQPYELKAAWGDSELFRVFDFTFIQGSAEAVITKPWSIVLMQSAATRLFGDLNPLGQTLQFGEHNLVISAVIENPALPSHFGKSDQAILSFDVLHAMPLNRSQSREWWLGTNSFTYALLPEENTGAVEKKLNRVLSSFSDQHIPDDQLKIASEILFGTMKLKELNVKILDNLIFRDKLKSLRVTDILFGLGALILMVSIINYSNLATALAAGYAKEIGMRKVIGASQISIAFQYWCEALILTVFGIVLGGILIFLASPILKVHTGIDLVFGLFANSSLWAWCLVLTVIVSVLASIYPVWYLSSVRPVEALRSGSVRGGNFKLTTCLVGVQFTVASALLILVFVVMQQNQFMKGLVLAPEEDPVVILERMAIGPGQHSDDYRKMIPQHPSLKSVSHINYTPWTNFQEFIDLSTGRTQSSAGVTGNRTDIGYDFFKTQSATLLAGRLYNPERDLYLQNYVDGIDRYQGEVPVVIDTAYAGELGFSSPDDAVGKPIYISRGIVSVYGMDPTFRIIGVVDTVPLVYGVGEVRSNIYVLSRFTEKGRNMNLMFRIDRTRVEEGLAAIEEMVKSINPNAVVNIRFTDDEFERNFKTYEGINLGFVSLSLIAFCISAIGLFAMAVFTTLQRRHEIGVRKTIGASTFDVVLELVKEFTWPVLIANLIAWPIGYYAANIYLHSFMQRMDLNLLPWLLGLIVTLCIAWLSVGGQSFRAARVKPSEVLKNE